ncbi:MAG: tRNA lysidine(34) synthetase TilS [Elusimicrobiota bacterium]|jgi:tRNA(Ile)-lysidine synthase|nr:tRNA lysidine(34) synthetase TilS [Elusimicrobiota bacterium]
MKNALKSAANFVWETFYKSCIDDQLIKPKDCIIIAVSGGADSMCLAHLFWRLAKKMEIKIFAAHFNHGLRLSSKNEQKLVEKICLKLNIPFCLECFDTKKFAKENKLSIETAARNLRYAALSKIAKLYKAQKIALGHNANDNAETIFLQMLRGAGNLSGIPYKRNLDKKIQIARPLLFVKRKFIENYADFHEIKYCTDETNFCDEFTRNKIRLNVLPNLEKINPEIISHLSSLAKITQMQVSYLNELSLKAIDKILSKSSNGFYLDLKQILRYNPAVIAFIIKNVLPINITSFQINLIINKIIHADQLPHRISKQWIFQIKSNKAHFYKNV